MRALSTLHENAAGASRPFDRDRDGFVMGEGAAIIVLESEEFAKARGAKIYATYGGQGIAADAHHIAQPEPEGRGVILAMNRALSTSMRTQLALLLVTLPKRRQFARCSVPMQTMLR
jgi:3-oxoacyl-[acyl-carrier-protein] synthase II